MDAKTLCGQLYSHYKSDAAVGEAIGVAQSTVNRIRKGVTQPSYETYMSMLAHAQQLESRPA